MADDNRRAGDWQHKDLRKNANDIEKGPTPDPRKWYKQTFWIIFFLIIFWPVGIVLAWRSDWHIAFKIIASVFIVAVVYFSITMQQTVLQMQAG